MTSFVRHIAFQVTKFDQHCLHIHFDNANPLFNSFPCSFIILSISENAQLHFFNLFTDKLAKYYKSLHILNTLLNIAIVAS